MRFGTIFLNARSKSFGSLEVPYLAAASRIRLVRSASVRTVFLAGMGALYHQKTGDAK